MRKNYLEAMPTVSSAIAIGGGAAGFFGAIAMAEINPQLKVTLIEAGRKPLA